MDQHDYPAVVRQEAWDSGFRMGLGAALAAVPLVLAWLLSRSRGRRGWLWWAGLALFVLFLPNAPYTLTDLIHLVRRIRLQHFLPSWAVILFVLPKFSLYLLGALLCYVLSLRLMGGYLRREGHGRLVRPLEALAHVLSAVGVYLGRAARLNSWDALANPVEVLGEAAGAARPGPALLILGVGVTLAALYYPLQYVVEAVLERWVGRPSREELLDLLRRNGLELGRGPTGDWRLRRESDCPAIDAGDRGCEQVPA
jgi:uncharacterized membrane protein